MMLTKTFWIGLGAALLVLTSCGYRFSGEGPGPKPEYTRLAIPVFENTTAEPALEIKITDALRRQFNFRSRMKLVATDQAQMVLKGRIKRLRTSDVAHRSSDKTIETRITMTVDVRCEDAADGTILWQAPNLSYYEEYRQSDDPIISFDNRQEALAYISYELAIRIHDRLLSVF